MKTKVIFRMFGAECVALFPQDAGTMDPYTCSSYAQVGQHSSACTTPYKSPLATRKQYASLARELRRIGYKIDIRKRTGRADYLMRLAQVSKR